MSNASSSSNAQDVAQIGALIERWAAAVRAQDLPTIVADHAPEMVMFDVPPPTQLRGIDAYRDSWQQLFDCFDDVADEGRFAVTELAVHAGADVAFATAIVLCRGHERSGAPFHLQVRLTMGLRKVQGRWTVLHEHHSIPATT
jgi:ketosteroid isomerase-like protein